MAIGGLGGSDPPGRPPPDLLVVRNYDPLQVLRCFVDGRCDVLQPRQPPAAPSDPLPATVAASGGCGDGGA